MIFGGFLGFETFFVNIRGGGLGTLSYSKLYNLLQYAINMYILVLMSPQLNVRVR